MASEIDDGAFFKTGAHIIQIDKRDYEAALSTANARVSAARRALAEEQGRARQAKREWRDLGSSSANELFLREPQLAEARSELSAAEATAQLAAVNLERTSIVAPFDGRIDKLHVDLGQYVSAGTRIADIYDTSAAEIRIPLTDRQLAILELPLGRSASSGPEVTITAQVAGQQHTWQGFITRTDATVDTHSRMYHAIAEVLHPFGTDESSVELPLMPGLFVTVEIDGKTINDVIVLPREALVKRRLIYVLDDENKILAEEVEVLRKSDSYVWLRTDIADGAQIVLEKHALLSVGTQVQPMPEPPSEQAESNMTQGPAQ